MKIAVIGFSGKVNKVIIEQVIHHPDCQLAGVLVRKGTTHSIYPVFESIEELAQNTQAIIDFTNPTTSIESLKKLANTNVVYVCGTTGFSEKEFVEFKEAAEHVTTIWSPNMSIGINLLQMLLKTVTKTLGDEFDAGIIDVHRKDKKDTPSGTALMFANAIKKINHKDVQISSLRIADIPGEHQVIFSSADESFTLTHNTFNRKIFANGAIKACFWGLNKPLGLYSMQDVLNLND